MKSLALSVGDFIRYWGFRKIHGAIWTQVYLSKIPLSCSDLTKRLKLSKALISPALAELCMHKLIFEDLAPNEKTKVYSADENVERVILSILKNRELKILNSVAENYSKLELLKLSSVRKDRLNSLGEMIQSAHLMLQFITSQQDLFKISEKVEK